MTVPFRYTPLKPGEIRLLHHSIRDGIVVWALKTVQIQEQGPNASVEFDALSYTWGDLGHTFPFRCNDSELRIHGNLKNALPYLARRRSSLPLWIDAVCINQSDGEEKFVQINMMHSIYRQATQVWVWLGCDPEHGDEAISLLPKVSAVAREVMSQAWEFDQASPVDKGLPAFSSPQWGAVTKIINNNYFSRLWIVQEAALARHIRVLYGDGEIPWDVLDDAVRNGPDLRHRLRDANGFKPLPLPGGTEVVFDIRKYTQSLANPQEVPFALMRLLVSTTRNHHCYDARDRVFGILGFFSGQDLQRVGIGRDMDAWELYTKLTRFLLANVNPSAMNWWYLLTLAWSSEKKRAGLPSWCPDYHNLGDSPTHPQELLLPLERHIASTTAKHHYDASRGKRVPPLPENPRAISVCGKIFDTVETLLPELVDVIKWKDQLTSVEEGKQRFLRFHAWEKSLAKAVLGDQVDNLPDDPTTMCTKEDEGRVRFTLDGYWRSLVGDMTERVRYTLTYETYRTFKVSLARWAELMEKLDVDFDSLILLHECAFAGPLDPAIIEADKEAMGLIGPNTPCIKYMSDSAFFLMGKRPFMTSMGRFGFGPLSLQEGDKVNPEGANYQIIGQAYVHDMMHGEVENLGIEEQDILLV
ncbi:hypothetical protein PFICI_11482 [Pestalotiopsis fici W106-1]|uniref:Heterokaryon incompatibility domain-containing protein n=1 Tax=Pestalotiopsis fici (strain W106-1 / CGMCC3.15140) TaxID=1229662 RepID=W3WQD6_PESFW|nr:uncharacterized protein PFICI_11482 [Pestalotiopsis fici W106-1]ETS76095.1 hypothetical protein PFICI_11482 [Pestalotiopsis fici W106-1]